MRFGGGRGLGDFMEEEEFILPHLLFFIFSCVRANMSLQASLTKNLDENLHL